MPGKGTHGRQKGKRSGIARALPFHALRGIFIFPFLRTEIPKADKQAYTFGMYRLSLLDKRRIYDAGWLPDPSVTTYLQ
jgi:hypothetical protein